MHVPVNVHSYLYRCRRCRSLLLGLRMLIQSFKDWESAETLGATKKIGLKDWESDKMLAYNSQCWMGFQLAGWAFKLAGWAFKLAGWYIS